MRDNLPTQLRDAAKKWREKHKNVGVGEMHYDFALEEAADAIEELTAELEYTKRQYELALEDFEKIGWGEWTPVTERLPKYGERVLVFGGFTMYVAYYDKNRYGGESWHKLNSKSHYCNPSHWMPLPEPPKEEEE